MICTIATSWQVSRLWRVYCALPPPRKRASLCGAYANLYSKAEPWSRSILTSTIKRRSTARADSWQVSRLWRVYCALPPPRKRASLCGAYANLYSKAEPWNRSILTSTIKRRSTARADLLFMAPATGIEPVTTP